MLKDGHLFLKLFFIQILPNYQTRNKFISISVHKETEVQYIILQITYPYSIYLVLPIHHKVTPADNWMPRGFLQ